MLTKSHNLYYISPQFCIQRALENLLSHSDQLPSTMIGARTATMFDHANQRLLMEKTTIRAIQHAVDELLHVCHVDMHIKVELPDFQTSHVTFRHKFPSHHEAVHFVKEAFDYVHTHPIVSANLRPEHECHVLKTVAPHLHNKWIDLGEDGEDGVVLFEGFARLPKEIQKYIISLVPSEHSNRVNCTVVSDLVHVRLASRRLRYLGNQVITEHILSFDCVFAT